MSSMISILPEATGSINNKNMRILKVLIIFWMGFTLACNPASEKKESITLGKEQKVQKEQNENENYNELKNKLQGVWKRTDYPFGTITIIDSKIKNDVGEGQLNEPNFTSFKIVDTCSDVMVNKKDMSAYFYYKESEVCEYFEISNDTLKLSDVQRSFTIFYKKVK